jgi:hypothetical protein
MVHSHEVNIYIYIYIYIKQWYDDSFICKVLFIFFLHSSHIEPLLPHPFAMGLKHPVLLIAVGPEPLVLFISFSY